MKSLEKRIRFTETVLRDGQQSQIATRMTTAEMTPVLQTLDEAGYHALEVWGGATFDSCLRFLNEDPWERLRTIRQEVKNTKLQMLLRGQNLLGYKNYPDDIVRAFIAKSIENGIDIIRVFDAFNDLRNLETAIAATKEAGGHCQVAISYTTSDFHTIDYYRGLAKEIAKIGADSLCIKDMAGVLTPQKGYELVSQIKDSTESLALAFEELGYDTRLDLGKINEAAEYFNPLRDRFRAEGLLNAKVKDTEPKTLIYQVPGGMLSNLLSQLKELGLEQRYEEVLAEVPKVRADLGFPPVVTPLSQMVGTQAVMNVLTGERYKNVPLEIKDYVRGLYGKSPVAIAPEIRQQIIGDEAVITQRPADLLAPGLSQMEFEIEEYAKSPEDVLSYALFPDQARDFLGRREDPFYDVPLQKVSVSLDIN